MPGWHRATISSGAVCSGLQLRSSGHDAGLPDVRRGADLQWVRHLCRHSLMSGNTDMRRRSDLWSGFVSRGGDVRGVHDVRQHQHLCRSEYLPWFPDLRRQHDMRHDGHLRCVGHLSWCGNM